MPLCRIFRTIGIFGRLDEPQPVDMIEDEFELQKSVESGIDEEWRRHMSQLLISYSDLQDPIIQGRLKVQGVSIKPTAFDADSRTKIDKVVAGRHVYGQMKRITYPA